MALAPVDRKLIRRILRVNHAGEHGAIAIYGAQIAAARKRHPELLAWLEETLSHEQSHRSRFLAAMPERLARPCRAMYLWYFGGAVLGWATAQLGPTGIMACTAAVERTVHRHLDDQITYLAHRDPPLAELIRAVQIEEVSHLRHAEQHHDAGALVSRALSLLVAAATEILIALATRGDSLRLPARLRKAALSVAAGSS